MKPLSHFCQLLNAHQAVGSLWTGWPDGVFCVTEVCGMGASWGSVTETDIGVWGLCAERLVGKCHRE